MIFFCCCCCLPRWFILSVLPTVSSHYHHRDLLSYYVFPFFFFFCQIILLSMIFFIIYFCPLYEFPFGEFLLLLLSEDWTHYHFRFYFLFLKSYHSLYSWDFFLCFPICLSRTENIIGFIVCEKKKKKSYELG